MHKLWPVFQEHLYDFGYVMQRYHTGPDGTKLSGRRKQGWKKIYMELRGSTLFRWEASDVMGLETCDIDEIKSGHIGKEEVEKFIEIDVVLTEISWIGSHRCHSNICNLVVIEGINGADKTYLNFATVSLFMRWRTHLKMARNHRRLFLLQNLAMHLKGWKREEHAEIRTRDLKMRWAGGIELDDGYLEMQKGELEAVGSKKRGKIKINKLQGVYMRYDGSIEIFGCFKSSSFKLSKVHVITLRLPDSSLFPAVLLKQILGRPSLSVCSSLVVEAQQAEDLWMSAETKAIEAERDAYPWEESAAKLAQLQPKRSFDRIESLSESPPPSELHALSHRRYEGSLESMFTTLLPILIEESPFDSVPVEFFYRALVNAWEAARIQLIPSPQKVAEWMRDRTYRTVVVEGREVWIGFTLRPINYELYRRRRDSNSVQSIQ